jgi:hypothetical protein
MGGHDFFVVRLFCSCLSAPAHLPDLLANESSLESSGITSTERTSSAMMGAGFPPVSLLSV